MIISFHSLLFIASSRHKDERRVKTLEDEFNSIKTKEEEKEAEVEIVLSDDGEEEDEDDDDGESMCLHVGLFRSVKCKMTHIFRW